MGEFIRRELGKAGQGLARHDQVARFSLMTEALSVSGGELTATLKLRRHEIEARYGDLIEELYGSADAGDRPLGHGRSR